jgi:shikimate dehydrogenase
VTRPIFVIGHPIGHSLSPAMHNAALAACGIDARYEAVDVAEDGLGVWIAGLRESDALGFNVTVPHKESVVAFLDALTGDATLTGAVNTVRRTDDGRLVGTNTDTLGIRRSLAEDASVSLRDQRVLLLGAGGAARAIALVALQDGARELVVANRHVDRAERLLAELAAAQHTDNLQSGHGGSMTFARPSAVDGAASIGASPSHKETSNSVTGSRTQTRAISLEAAELSNVIAASSVVINATSVGLRSMELPADPSPMASGSLAVDIVYNPPETAFLAAARQRGIRILPGLGMLIHQAAAAFELWTGTLAPIDVMRMAAAEALERQLNPRGA